jgi:hypothetical protein
MSIYDPPTVRSYPSLNSMRSVPQSTQSRRSKFGIAVDVLAEPEKYLLAFNYVDDGGTFSTGRRVAVNRIDGNKVYGSDQLRGGDFRSFNLDRMINVRAVEVETPANYPAVIVGDVIVTNTGVYTFVPGGSLMDMQSGHLHPDNLVNRVGQSNRISNETLDYWFRSAIQSKTIRVLTATRIRNLANAGKI